MATIDEQILEIIAKAKRARAEAQEPKPKTLMDDVLAFLERPDAKELFDKFIDEGLAKLLVAFTQGQRVKCWWFTYHVALPAIVATTVSPKVAHERASDIADLAHGSIRKADA